MLGHREIPRVELISQSSYSRADRTNPDLSSKGYRGESGWDEREGLLNRHCFGPTTGRSRGVVFGCCSMLLRGIRVG